jgi:nucleotide-binding universal stress UspA family protein
VAQEGEGSRPTIVVGVDGSDGAGHALEWAAEEARLRDARLRVVLAWQIPFALYTGPGTFGVDRELTDELRELAEKQLEEACEAASGLQGLDLERSVIQDLPAPALVEAAKNAALLVVATRGRGGFAGLLLGSVSQQCAHHASCPVVIVPPPG